MEQELAISFLRTLYNVFNYEPLKNETVRQEYMKILMDFDGNEVYMAGEVIYKKYKFCPRPSELYNELMEIRKQEKQNKAILDTNHCYVCNNDGFVVIRREGANDPNGGYQYVLYCPHCDKGERYRYDGTKCKNKTPYFSNPIDKYYDIDELKAKNVFQKKKGPIPMPDYVLKECKKHGLNPRVLLGR